MVDWKSRFKYPFIYLDSSSVLRDANVAVEMLTRKFANKNPDKFRCLIQKLKNDSYKDNSYYGKILKLQRKGLISKVITMEVINPYIKSNNENIIKLFGTLNDKIMFRNDNGDKHILDCLTLWNGKIEVSTYNKAALAIANAICVIADSTFLTISVGRSLASYIMSECPFFITAFDNKPLDMEANFTICDLSPKELINYLSSAH